MYYLQIKGCWNDIKGIHSLLEKIVGTPAKAQQKVSVKTEPKTGLTDDEDNECPEETVKGLLIYLFFLLHVLFLYMLGYIIL